jgi:hypothetical protein
MIPGDQRCEPRREEGTIPDVYREKNPLRSPEKWCKNLFGYILVPKAGRGSAGFCFKHIAKVKNGLKTEFVTDFLNAFVGGDQEFFCPNNTELQVVLAGRYSGVFFKHFPEIGVADVVFLGQRVEVEVAG